MVNIPNIPGGARKQKAEKLMAEAKAKAEKAKETAAQAKEKADQAQKAAGDAQQKYQDAKKTGTEAYGKAKSGEFLPVDSEQKLADIAQQRGITKEDIWSHPLNKQLREERGSMDAIEPGDAVYVPEAPQEEEETVGEGDYIVKAGDCMSSIAKKAGVHWETIWNDPKNQELKERRGDPNVLKPGDKVHIRAKEIKEESGASEERHRFRLLGQPAVLRLQLLADDEPRANEKYVLVIGNKEFEGHTDAEGKLEHPIPPNATRGILKVGDDPEAQDMYELKLGQVAPVRDVRGAQQRLFNLGFDPGPLDGILGPKTENAIRAFQKAHDLNESGRMDPETAEKLVDVHGC